MRTNKKGQSIMEYAILLAVVVSAITAMALYVRRAIQANIRTIEKQINAETNETGQMIIEYAIMFTVIVAVILTAATTLIKPSVNKIFIETSAALNKVADTYVAGIVDN